MVMDTDEYEHKVTTILSDDKTYEKLKKDPTYSYLTAKNVQRMYPTPKIHKPDKPLRPVVDYTGSNRYNVSRSR